VNAFRLIGTALHQRRRFVAALSCAVGLVVVAQRANAQGAVPAAAASAEPVVLEVPDCLDVRGSDVKPLVALEITPRLRVVADGEVAGQQLLTASVRCRATGPVELVVVDPRKAAPLRSEIELAKTPANARTRLLALALAELIATSRMTGSAAGSASTPASETETESESASGSRASALVSFPYRLWVGAGLARAGSPGTTLYGADVGGSRVLGSFALDAQLDARWGAASLDQGEVTVQSFAASLAIAPVLAAGPVQLQVGPGLRAGYLRLAATPRSTDRRGDSLAGVWFGPIAAAAVQLALFEPGMLRLGVEAGYAVHSVAGRDVDDSRLLDLRGAWFSTTLAFALGLR
jgi:hypothetical protein